jgi:alpha-beta hydrolase superfamily lysophospholipase
LFVLPDGLILRFGKEHSQKARIIMNQETDRPVHSHGVSTGAAAARMVLPTTAPWQSSLVLSSARILR